MVPYAPISKKLLEALEELGGTEILPCSDSRRCLASTAISSPLAVDEFIAEFGNWMEPETGVIKAVLHMN